MIDIYFWFFFSVFFQKNEISGTELHFIQAQHSQKKHNSRRNRATRRFWRHRRRVSFIYPGQKFWDTTTFSCGIERYASSKTDDNVCVFAVNGFPLRRSPTTCMHRDEGERSLFSRHLILEVGLHSLPWKERDCICTFLIFNRNKIAKNSRLSRTQIYLLLERN